MHDVINVSQSSSLGLHPKDIEPTSSLVPELALASSSSFLPFDKKSTVYQKKLVGKAVNEIFTPDFVSLSDKFQRGDDGEYEQSSENQDMVFKDSDQEAVRHLRTIKDIRQAERASEERIILEARDVLSRSGFKKAFSAPNKDIIKIIEQCASAKESEPLSDNSVPGIEHKKTFQRLEHELVEANKMGWKQISLSSTQYHWPTSTSLPPAKGIKGDLMVELLMAIQKAATEQTKATQQQLLSRQVKMEKDGIRNLELVEKQIQDNLDSLAAAKVQSTTANIAKGLALLGLAVLMIFTPMSVAAALLLGFFLVKHIVNIVAPIVAHECFHVSYQEANKYTVEGLLAKGWTKIIASLPHVHIDEKRVAEIMTQCFVYAFLVLEVIATFKITWTSYGGSISDVLGKGSKAFQELLRRGHFYQSLTQVSLDIISTLLVTLPQYNSTKAKRNEYETSSIVSSFQQSLKYCQTQLSMLMMTIEKITQTVGSLFDSIAAIMKTEQTTRQKLSLSLSSKPLNNYRYR